MSLPTDALEPNVKEISIDSQQLFSVFLSHKENISRDALMHEAIKIQKKFEGNYNIDSVVIEGGDTSEIEVIILGEKLEALGISPAKIADEIRAYNQSFPLGNFTIDTRTYDLRIEGNIESFEALLRVPISLADNSSIPL